MVESMQSVISVSNLSKTYASGFQALKHINLDVPENKVTAFIGPSGCGKSTVLRALNRMNDLIPGCGLKGRVVFDGVDLYERGVDPVARSSIRSRKPPLNSLKPSSSISIPNRKIATPAAIS